jgi:hypothetical protein
MPFIGHEVFFQQVRAWRTLAFEGRVGGGKTSLAFAIASHLLEDRRMNLRYLVSNAESIWTDEPGSMTVRDERFLDSVVIVDEAGLFIKGGPDADEYLAFTRKMNLILMFPSANDMTRKITKLAVSRVYNLQLIGLPMWIYEWSLRTKSGREKGKFGWWQPSEIWGVFNTEHMPYDDAGISIWLQKHIEQIIENQPATLRYAEGTATQSIGGRKQIPGLEGGEGVIEDFAQAAGELSDALSLSAQQSGKRRR